MTMGIDEKLSINKYNLDETTHITVEQSKCKACVPQPCLTICPAGVYRKENGEIQVNHAGCLECATCLTACPMGSISWTYPQGSFGISYRYA